jgi:hypothetical protein
VEERRAGQQLPDGGPERSPQLGRQGAYGCPVRCASECMPGPREALLLRLNDHLFARLGAVADLDPMADKLLWSYPPALAVW